MDRNELLRELDRIIDVGIVNAKHDSDILRHIRKQLQESDLDAFKRILSGCKSFHGHWDVSPWETESGKAVFDITIRDFADSVTLCFDQEGRLIG